MNGMFVDCANFNSDISSWDTRNVLNMGDMFDYPYLTSVFNIDISSWDTSRVTNFFKMFASADAFNFDLSSWDISSATSMKWMFLSTTSFSQTLCWDVTGITTTQMFLQASGGGSLSSYDDSGTTVYTPYAMTDS